MATVDAPMAGLPQSEVSQNLASSWRRLTRAATVVAVITSPALYVWFTQQNDMVWWKALIATLAIVVVFRGFADLLFRRLIRAEPLRHREPGAPRGGHRRAPPRLVLAVLVQDRCLLRRDHHGRLALQRRHVVARLADPVERQQGLLHGIDVLYARLSSASTLNDLNNSRITNVSGVTNVSDVDNWQFRFRVHRDFYP